MASILASPFPSQTAWSAVLGARDRESPEWKDQFDRLVSTYWRPVFGFLVRRWKLESPDAADLTQEFFLKLYESDALQEASPERGRFRTFVKLKLRDLVVDELRRRSALKRGGELKTVRIPVGRAEEVELPGCDGLSPEEAFDREWAAGVLGRSLRELEDVLKAAGKEVMYEAFRRCAVCEPPESYRQAAESLGIKEGDVANYVFRARVDLREIVRRRVRDSVENDSELQEEVAYLLKVLG